MKIKDMTGKSIGNFVDLIAVAIGAADFFLIMWVCCSA